VGVLTRYGITSIAWVAPFTTADLWLIGHVRSLGFEILELPVWDDPLPFDVAQVAAELRRHGVEATIGTFQTADRDLTDSDPAVRARGVAHLRRCVDVARALCAPRIAGPLAAAHSSFRLRGPTEMTTDFERSSKELRGVAEYARDNGVTLIYEPLNRYEISFGTRARDVAALVDAVGSPALKMMVDVFHANIEETSLADAVAAAGDRLAYVHAIENHRGSPGTGSLDWTGLARALARINYDGPIVLEPLPHHVEWLALAGRIWHPPAPSPDDLEVRPESGHAG
jgi:D-psicose/D-tagatose/L-ribulose 3-epimerase